MSAKFVRVENPLHARFRREVDPMVELLKAHPVSETEAAVMERVAQDPDFAAAFQRTFYFEDLPTADRFLDEPYYTGEIGASLYEVWRQDFRDYCKHPYQMVFLGGSIGCGKNTFSKIIGAWELFLILNMRRPQEYFRVDKATDIYVNVFSIRGEHATEGWFTDLKKVVDTAQFFDQFRLKKGLETRMVFRLGESGDSGRGHLIVKPLSPNRNNAIGKQVVMNVMDEANFMEEVENSKRANKASGTKNYRQAEEIFEASMSRVESRQIDEYGTQFIPAKFICLSSQKYFGDFLNKQMDLHKDNSFAFIRRYKQWETRDWPKRVRKWYFLNVSETEEPTISEQPLHGFDDSIAFPEPLLAVAERNLLNFLIEFIGYRYTGQHRFYQRSWIGNLFATKMVNGFNPNLLAGAQGFASRMEIRVDRATARQPHFFGVDLATSTANAAIAVGRVEGADKVEYYDGHFLVKDLFPVIRWTHLLAIEPPQTSPISYTDIRLVIFLLAKHLRLVEGTFDGFQSEDSIQLCARRGIPCRVISTDKAGGPDYLMRDYMSMGLMKAPLHEHLKLEMEEALEDPRRNVMMKGNEKTDIVKAMGGATRLMADWFYKHHAREFGIDRQRSRVHTDAASIRSRLEAMRVNLG